MLFSPRRNRNSASALLTVSARLACGQGGRSAKRPSGLGNPNSLAGTLFAKTRELTGDLEGFASGAMSGWHDLQQVVHASLDGIVAFGVANDIGLALGLVEVTDLTLEVTSQKFQHHYLLQEITLELGSLSVLYGWSRRITVSQTASSYTAAGTTSTCAAIARESAGSAILLPWSAHPCAPAPSA